MHSVTIGIGIWADTMQQLLFRGNAYAYINGKGYLYSISQIACVSFFFCIVSITVMCAIIKVRKSYEAIYDKYSLG